jgi:alpha-tubulin suppressor-like RCC1 family protein
MKTCFRHLIIAPALPMLLALDLQSSTMLATPVVTQIAAGENTSLYVMSDGSLWGMGDNYYGELGLGQTNTGTSIPTEIVVGGVTTVCAGYVHTLFRESDGSLWGMGYNQDGELGDGTYTTQFSPEKLVSSQVTVIAAGYEFSLYGTFHFPAGPSSLLGMGYDSFGQLGKGFFTTNRPQVIVSSPIGEGAAATAVAAGEAESLFIQPGGSLWDMGDNLFGELGDGTTSNKFAPEEIVASNVVAVAASEGADSLFIKSDGSLWGMGYNGDGQLGIGNTDPTNTVPEEIVASNVVAVAAGDGHTLFIKSDGSLWGMGVNGKGQLGIGDTNPTNTIPVQILPGNVSAIAAGGTRSLFIKSDGSLWGMGDNTYGLLGDARYTGIVYVPIEIVPLAPLANGGFETGDFTAWTDTGNVDYSYVSAKPAYVHSGVYGAQLGPIGSLGFLSQTLFTAPGTNYALSFWLNSPDGEVPNEFQVSWNGTTIFDQTNLPALGWTNIVLQVAATGSDTVRFGARNDNSYFGIDDISLVPLQQPLIIGVSWAGTNLVLNATNGQSGGTYFTLTSTNLGLPLNQWTRVGTNILSVSGSFTITATNAVHPNTPSQFFILAQQD